MAFSYNLTTDCGKVRLLIRDHDEDYVYYSDEEIECFLTLAAELDGDPVYNASAEALESWASNQVMILKVVEQLDTRVDGAAVSREMRQRAALLRTRAVSLSDDAGFEVAEMAIGHFSWVEQVTNEAIEDV